MEQVAVRVEILHWPQLDTNARKALTRWESPVGDVSFAQVPQPQPHQCATAPHLDVLVFQDSQRATIKLNGNAAP